MRRIATHILYKNGPNGPNGPNRPKKAPQILLVIQIYRDLLLPAVLCEAHGFSGTWHKPAARDPQPRLPALAHDRARTVWFYGFIASKSWAIFLSFFGPFGPVGPFGHYEIGCVTQYTTYNVTQYV